jgi:hypothetical protein
LWFYPEKEVEKIPMGFDSEESFTEMDEDYNIANGIRVEMMELKPVEIKKAIEKRASGEVLSVKTCRRAMSGNSRIREASGTTGGPRSLRQRPSNLAHTLVWSR